MLIWVDHHLVFTKDYCQSKATKIDTIQIQIMCTEARKHEQMHTSKITCTDSTSR
jgi:hypothetical protein